MQPHALFFLWHTGIVLAGLKDSVGFLKDDLALQQSFEEPDDIRQLSSWHSFLLNPNLRLSRPVGVLGVPRRCAHLVLALKSFIARNFKCWKCSITI